MKIIYQQKKLISGLSILALLFVSTPAFGQDSFANPAGDGGNTQETQASKSLGRSATPASNNGSFVVSPAKDETILDPGQSITKSLTVTNRNSESVTFALSVQDVTGSKTGEQAVVLLPENQTTPNSLKNIIRLPQSEFTLGPSESITVPVEINIPSNASPGGLYGAIIVSNAPSKLTTRDAAGTQIPLVSQVAPLFFVRINGPVSEEGRLLHFRIPGIKRLVHTQAPELFEFTFENSGSVYLTPYGQIEVKNLAGATVALIPIDANYVYPDAIRSFQVIWDESGLKLGRYQAELTLNWGRDGSNQAVKVINFWIIPIKVILPALVLIILLFAAIHFIRSRFEFRRRKR